MSLLKSIESPQDIKTLSEKELARLCKEIRDVILDVVANNGGHLSSNLGIVELTLALHRVFDSPKDSIIWDVGHQTYVHKLITGRYKDFHTLRQRRGISGFPKREESKHDCFNTGHASTSISAALGIAQALFLQGKDGRSIAVIGDGAMTGGMAFEGISLAGDLKRPLIVILNDNQMSISKNTGSFARYLSSIIIHPLYQKVKYTVGPLLQKFPFFGHHLLSFISSIKRSIKGVFYKNNIFVELGFEYVGPIDGHNIKVLEKVFRSVKRLKMPVVVHVRTIKGYGYRFARENPQVFHSTAPFDLADGKVKRKTDITFTQSFSESLIAEAKNNKNIVAITAAMPNGTGLIDFQRLYPNRFFDVGIAEEHAVTFAAGLATQGLVPVVAIYSTFIQRAVDQVIHDVALQNLHVIFMLDRAGVVAQDGETHQGAFDISIFRAVPNISVLSPASNMELSLMLNWALKENGPVIIRYPKKATPKEVPSFFSVIEKGRGVFSFKHKKSKALIVCIGSIYQEVDCAAQQLREEGVYADIYNLRFIKPFDEKYFLSIAQKYSCIFAFEDGVKTGGIAEYIECILLKNSSTQHVRKKIHIIAFPDLFLSQGSREEILEGVSLSSAKIATFISSSLQA